LHSSKLEQLGLKKAAASFCREFSGRHKVKIDFTGENVPEGLPMDISLSLFRVLQESLQNAVKHSGSQRFQVLLMGSLFEINLTVRDSGKGFDPQMALSAEGIGLASMRERLKLVHGQLWIETAPQHGTTIAARIPLGQKVKSACAG
jgi:signal transduction histidine kinase